MAGAIQRPDIDMTGLVAKDAPVHASLSASRALCWNFKLSPDCIYSGHYWDSFALPGLLAARPQRALFLGLGGGGGVRPALSTMGTPALEFVDHDTELLARTTDYYHHHFPCVAFEAVCADAADFVRASDPATYDIVFLDLFDESGHSALVTDPGFIKALAGLVSPHGVMLVNLTGVPDFMGFASDGCPLRDVTARCGQSFAHCASLPYRRNVNLICAHAPLKPVSLPRLTGVRPLEELYCRAMFFELCHGMTPRGRSAINRIAPSYSNVDRFCQTRADALDREIDALCGEFAAQEWGVQRVPSTDPFLHGRKALDFLPFAAMRRPAVWFYLISHYAADSATGSDEYAWFPTEYLARFLRGEYDALAPALCAYGLVHALAMLLHRRVHDAPDSAALSARLDQEIARFAIPANGQG